MFSSERRTCGSISYTVFQLRTNVKLAFFLAKQGEPDLQCTPEPRRPELLNASVFTFPVSFSGIEDRPMAVIIEKAANKEAA